MEFNFGTTQYTLSKAGNQLLLNGKAVEFDAVKTGPQQYHVIYDNASITVEWISGPDQDKQCVAKVNGKIITFTYASDMDVLLKKMGIAVQNTKKANHLKAPMPGLVLKVLVEKGQKVEVGTPLVILESMKMENVLKAATAATIAQVKIGPGETVEKGQLLVEFESE